MRLYVSKPEAQELLGGVVPESVTAKVARQLNPPEPIPGQTDIYDHLEEDHACAAAPTATRE